MTEYLSETVYALMRLWICQSPISVSLDHTMYREPAKGLQILLSRTQAGPGRAVKQEQEEISPNHIQAIYGTSVDNVVLNCVNKSSIYCRNTFFCRNYNF